MPYLCALCVFAAQLCVLGAQSTAAQNSSGHSTAARSTGVQSSGVQAAAGDAGAVQSSGQAGQTQEAEQPVLTLQESEKNLPIGTSEPQNFSDTGNTNTLWLFIRMIVVLIFVIVCIYALVFLLKKGFAPKNEQTPFLKKAASLNLAPGKSVHIVLVPDKAWLVGVSDSSVNLIGEITDKELIDRIALEAEKEISAKPKDFAEILAAFTGSVRHTENILKKQRSRMERGGRNE